jgi:hypothetical protein
MSIIKMTEFLEKYRVVVVTTITIAILFLAMCSIVDDMNEANSATQAVRKECAESCFPERSNYNSYLEMCYCVSPCEGK